MNIGALDFTFNNYRYRGQKASEEILEGADAEETEKMLLIEDSLSLEDREEGAYVLEFEHPGATQQMRQNTWSEKIKSMLGR